MNWWHYLLLVNIYLTLFFGFYSLLLRRETFFQLNRIYLIGTAILSFFIPLIQSDWVKDLFITRKVQYTLYGTGAGITDIAPIKDNPLTIGQVLIVLYAAGVIFLAARLMLQLILLRQIIKNPAPSASYSFFNKIKVNDGIDGKDVIHSHELVHARQFHSADVLIIEAVMIINWFNPVVYLYRLAIKHVHEYIADRHTLKAGTNKAEYALLLLSQTFDTPAHQLVNPFFNHSLLKKRIMMLQKNRSARIKLIKYGLSAPLFVLMLILSSATISNSKAVDAIHDKAKQVFDAPAKAILADTTYKTTIITYDPKTDKLPVAPADTVPDKNKNQVFTQVEHVPTFPGGENAFAQYLVSNIKYPADAKKNKVEGRSVITFIVEKDGSLSDLKVVRALGSGTDEEAIRVLKASPKWNPGVQNGKTVRVQYSIPVSFSLGNKITATGQPVSGEGSEVFISVEQAPSFPGGDAAFGKFLATNVRYPKAAREANLQGRVVASFIIEKDGSLSNIKVIRGVGMGIDEEAVRVLGLSPNWNPGIQNGHNVRVSYAVPINFALAEEEKSPKPGYAPNTQQGKTLLDTTKTKATFSLKNMNGNPLYVLDGKVVKSVGGVSPIQTLNPNDIESISVIKGDNATKTYGMAAVNGVVEIHTKKKIKL
ncbi:M56 family metallopeptidase [Mucilaginibacter phyllosphaerae]|uniref:TonB family protein n=1 Tax=Mucilaginibacter phyllosphaerae TaxID=1812349 RepID=A0A4Y8AA05_9SPHI|nr:M56 family metallopeptidase [Mucilaginibacter phyllosphaerae]MBB3969892.1 TonB family protein [Mucilaginibacter phyllosphaerae]TEW65266.1 TonB family protein [Mucilaginibacter phyllosphaerae]GGH16951.1 cell envelope biogenesis protein TonB [Mucilaginibacter phyllosphaerae]